MKKIIYPVIIIFLLMVGHCFVAHANDQIKGISLGKYVSGCDYYLIQDPYGSYSLVEWFGGTDTGRDDIVYGDLYSFGFKDLYDATNKLTTHVWIDNYWLSHDRASEKLTDHCGWSGNMLNYYSGIDSLYNPPTNYTAPPTNLITCPTNATYLNGDCTCNDGYVANGNMCVTYNQSCQSLHGIKAYGDKKYCYCPVGYKFNKNNQCVDNNSYCQEILGSHGKYDINNNNCICENGYQVNSTKDNCEQTQCPQNSTLSFGNQCICRDGYVMRNNQCVTYAQDCQNNFGQNTIGLRGDNGNSSCSCANGYQWNSDKTACIIISVQNQNAVSQVNTNKYTFSKKIKLGSMGKDVVALQKILVSNNLLQIKG